MNGGAGDGVADDTAALKSLFAKYWGCKIIFIDAGKLVPPHSTAISSNVPA